MASDHIHILGIGGSGLSAIAQLLIEQGLRVSGCDRSLNAAAQALVRRGATVFEGHDAAHLEQADTLLITSAVPADHLEVRAARERGLPVITRHDLWREWSRQRDVVAVTGTHGKTTTTGMITQTLHGSGVACGYLVGAPLPGLGAASWGTGPLVLEADEYARTFLAVTPRIAVITNIDWDHVDIYPSQEDYDAAFREFAEQTLAAGGTVIACGDDAGVQRALAGLSIVTYGLGEHNVWRATSIEQQGDQQQVVVEKARADRLALRLGVPGEHNVRNALAALAAAALLDVPLEQAATALAGFQGTARRFEPKGAAGGITVFDDYAHHPVEIAATLQGARSRFPGKRLIAYFQPHTFSRVQAFLPDFARALAAADVVRVGAIYAAREAGSAVSGEQIVTLMDHQDARFVGDLDAATADLLATVQPGDVLLTLGAGDGYLVGERVLAAIAATQDAR